MRISDWSSDVCSFYLCRDASLASPRRRREGEGESAMRRARSAAVAVCLLGGLLGGLSGTVGGGIAAAGAQENPMLGSWTAVDPRSDARLVGKKCVSKFRYRWLSYA